MLKAHPELQEEDYKMDIKSAFYGDGGNITKLTAINGIPTFVTLILRASFVFAGLILLFFFIMGGLGMIGSAGKNDPKAMEQAKATLTSAVTGFIVVFMAYWIVKLIGNILNIPNLI